MTSQLETILALDVGERRIGIARAHLSVRMAHPLETLEDPDTFIPKIIELCESEKAAALIIGLPRGLDGQDTAQTKRVQEFGSQLELLLTVPVYWIDEALTSAKAQAELQNRGKPYAKSAVDSLAATYILEDFLKEHKETIYG